MPVVQTSVHPGGAAAVHSGSPFPVSVATVMAPGAAPPQTVLLTSPPTRSLTPETQQLICFYFPYLGLGAGLTAFKDAVRFHLCQVIKVVILNVK